AGKPVLVGLAPGSSESHDAWADFLAGLVTRGLRAPLLVISDGAEGLIGAAERVFDRSLRQRCLIHRSWKEIMCRFPSLGACWCGMRACAYRWRSVVNSPPGSRSCCRT